MTIAVFSEFLKKLLGAFRALKKKIKDMLTIQEEQFGSQRAVMMMLKNYEERNFSYIADSPADQSNLKLILGGSNNELFRGLVEAADKLRNPFMSLLCWVKGQIADVKAMDEAITQRANVLALVPKIKVRRAQLQKDLDSAVNNRTTFKTFFKSRTEIN